MYCVSCYRRVDTNAYACQYCGTKIIGQVIPSYNNEVPAYDPAYDDPIYELGSNLAGSSQIMTQPANKKKNPPRQQQRSSAQKKRSKVWWKIVLVVECIITVLLGMYFDSSAPKWVYAIFRQLHIQPFLFGIGVGILLAIIVWIGIAYLKFRYRNA